LLFILIPVFSVTWKSQYFRSIHVTINILFQTDLLLAAEAAKTSQRADLENHIKTAQNMVEEKTNELSKMKQQWQQVET